MSPTLPRVSLTRIGLGILLLVFLGVLVRTAWLCDDAYISLRTVDNFVQGHGLRWNVAERVQVYTHPLWILVLAAAFLLTDEIYLTTILLSIGLSCLALALVTMSRQRPFLASATGLLVCILSPSFVSYCTSGLENPLSFLLLGVFLVVQQRPRTSSRRPFWLGLLAGAALVNRLDLVWLYAPPLLFELYRQRDRATAARMVLGFLPLVAWLSFSLVYYGFLLPNPALGKLNTGIGFMQYVRQGSAYFLDILSRDILTSLVILFGLTIGWIPTKSTYRMGAAAGRRPPSETIGISMGILLYLVYLLTIGGDFMRGRFLTIPLLASVGLLVHREGLWTSRARFSVPVLVVLLGMLVPNPTLVSGKNYGSLVDPNEYRRTSGIADERATYYKHYGLLNGMPLKDKPGHDMDRLRQVRSRDMTRIRLIQAAGRSGFIAGAGPYLVDSWALVDPLLARLQVAPGTAWRIGHMPRNVPAGYLETLLSGGDRIQDARLREYYARLARITRGPIFSSGRWREIVRMNLGRPNALVRGYTSYPALDGDEYTRLCRDPTAAGPELLWSAAVNRMESGDLVGVEAILRRLFALPSDYKYGIILPDLVQEIVKHAVASYRDGQRDFAMGLLQLTMELAPDRPETLYTLGVIKMQGGQTAEALLLFRQAAGKGYTPALKALGR